MGLDLHVKGHTSTNSKIGSYIGFGEFRKAWAKHLGFNLYDMEGYKGTKAWTEEPLQCFFNHSDCDGRLSVDEAREILEQAKKDYPMIHDKQSDDSFPILMEFCQASIDEDQPIEFS